MLNYQPLVDGSNVRPPLHPDSCRSLVDRMVPRCVPRHGADIDRLDGRSERGGRAISRPNTSVQVAKRRVGLVAEVSSQFISREARQIADAISVAYLHPVRSLRNPADIVSRDALAT